MFQHGKTLCLLALLASPALAETSRRTDFDVANHEVNSQTGAGKTEIASISKVEALEGGDVLSESSFFFPASADKIADQLYSAEGIGKLAAFAASVTETGKTENGWSGEMTIDADKANKRLARNSWMRELKQATDKHGTYKLQFDVSRVERNGVTEITFNLHEGKIFSKLQVTVRVIAGGPAATSVTVQSRSNSKLGSNVGDRMSIAKGIIRESPSLLDRLFN